MPPSQLEDAHQHANSGKEATNQGNLKMASDDYAVTVQDSLLADATRRMAKAVGQVQEQFRRKHQHGKPLRVVTQLLSILLTGTNDQDTCIAADTSEDAEGLKSKLSQEADRGR